MLRELLSPRRADFEAALTPSEFNRWQRRQMRPKNHSVDASCWRAKKSVSCSFPSLAYRRRTGTGPDSPALMRWIEKD